MTALVEALIFAAGWDALEGCRLDESGICALRAVLEHRLRNRWWP